MPVSVSRKHSMLISMALALMIASQSFAQTGPINVKGDLHVLSAGVNLPTYMQPKDKLRSADKDAKAHEAFWPTQKGSIFNDVHVAPALTNENGTCKAILDGLDRMVEVAKPGDTGLVDLSGHGGMGQSHEWNFCAYDAPLPSSALRERIERLAKKGVRVILILDTCECGGVGISGDNIIVLAACQANEQALDAEDHGLFTRVLLEGLNGAADTNKDGIITLAKLNAYVSLRMEQLTHKQCPTCGCPANIRSNLPLAVVHVGPVVSPSTVNPPTVPGIGHFTGNYHPQK